MGNVVDSQEEGVPAISRNQRPYYPSGDITPEILSLDRKLRYVEARGL
jgi:hypothetical protein